MHTPNAVDTDMFLPHIHVHTTDAHSHTLSHTLSHTCIVPCDPLDIPSNGKAYFSIANGLSIGSGNYGNTTVHFSPGDAAQFSCDGGSSLVGQNTIGKDL